MDSGNIDKKFQTFHNKDALFKQNNRAILSTLLKKSQLDSDTNYIVELITKYQGGLHQEIFYPVEGKSMA